MNRKVFFTAIVGFLFSTAALAKPSYILLKNTPDLHHSASLTKTTGQYVRSSVSRKILREEFTSGEVLSWNKEARDLVSKTKTVPPKASRIYALLSVGQYDAVQAARQTKNSSEKASVSEVSYRVLSYLFPDAKRELRKKNRRGIRYAYIIKKESLKSLVAGRALAAVVAKNIIARAKTDGADAQWSGQIPQGAQYWRSSDTPAKVPLLPLWGKVTPWFLTRVDELRPEPPPSLDSEEFKAALAEVRAYSDHRTPEQQAIAKFWADGAGTSTPSGHWNQIAADILNATKSSELEAASVMAALNMAMMDAGICCWDAKYAYWLLRPSQADPMIVLAVPLPNFPSYTSGHATFSGAGATVLSAAFPSLAPYMKSLAEEAAISRVYGGIHYRFDSDIGLKGGEKIGTRAAEWLKRALAK